MDAVKEYTEIKRKLEAATKQKSEAEGGLKQIKARLKKEFDCSTLSAAKKKLEKLRGQREKDKQTRDEAIKAFKKDWPDELDED